MERGLLVTAFSLSASLHLLLLLAVIVSAPAMPGRGSGGALSIELRFDAAGLSGPMAVPEAPPAAPVPPPPPPVRPEPPAAREVARVVRPETIDGVRIATREDVERRKDSPAPEPEPRRVEPAPAPPAEGARGRAREPGEAPAAPPVVARASGPAGAGLPSGPAGVAPGGSTSAPAARVVRPRPGGGFRPDQLGYDGRIFGQRSIRAGSTTDAFYGRIHLFADDGGYRDYSDSSLFGFNFRHELPGGGVREFQIGRVQTHGAYLVVTDLFPNGRLSTMSHTVVMPFPREAPAGSALWEVREEPTGHFRLRGPAGSSFVFDGRNGAFLGARGFVVAAAGATGTPPAVAYEGLHVRIHAVGGNPFLRGRAATVVDAAGRRCALTTSDLFVYDGGRLESDMFRYASDRGLFDFLAARCPSLAVPRPAEVLLAKPAPSERKPQAVGTSGGLLPTLFRAFGE